MANVLPSIIRNPPGDWSYPDSVNTDAERQRWTDVVSGPHRAVTKVVVWAPNTSVVGGELGVESWVVPFTDGSVTWDIDSYPEGTATVTVSLDFGQWEPGPEVDDSRPAGRHLYPNNKPQPTIGSDLLPKVLLPGAIIAIYRGFAVRGQDPVGFRVFDGFVTGASMNRAAGTVTLQCLDFSGLMDRVAVRHYKALGEAVWDDGGPIEDPPQVSATQSNHYYLWRAVAYAMRKSTEGWWPEPKDEDEGDPGTGLFDLAVGYNAYEGVRIYYDLGGKSLWSCVEDWADSANMEVYMLPGRRGDVMIARPADVDEKSDWEPTTLRVGQTVTSWSTGYDVNANKVLLTWRRPYKEERRNDYGPGGYRASRLIGTPNGDVRMYWKWDGTEFEVMVDQEGLDNPFNGTPSHNWNICWNDPRYPDTWELAAFNTGGNGVRRRTASHRYPPMIGKMVVPKIANYSAPNDEYLIYSTSPDNGWLIQQLQKPDTKYVGRWQKYPLDASASVRSAGPVVYTKEREISAGKASQTDQPPYSTDKAVDRAAQGLAKRIRGTNRTNTVEAVPMPWLTTRDTVKLDLGKGVHTQRHMIASLTMPLRHDGVMRLGTVKPNWGSPSYDDPSVEVVGRRLVDEPTRTFDVDWVVYPDVDPIDGSELRSDIRLYASGDSYWEHPDYYGVVVQDETFYNVKHGEVQTTRVTVPVLNGVEDWWTVWLVPTGDDDPYAPWSEFVEFPWTGDWSETPPRTLRPIVSEGGVVFQVPGPGRIDWGDGWPVEVVDRAGQLEHPYEPDGGPWTVVWTPEGGEPEQHSWDGRSWS